MHVKNLLSLKDKVILIADGAGLYGSCMFDALAKAAGKVHFILLAVVIVCTNHLYGAEFSVKIECTQIISNENIIRLNSLARTINGDLIVAATQDSNFGEPVRTLIFRSSDEGKTWKQSNVIRDTKCQKNVYASIQRLPDGNWNFGDLLLAIIESDKKALNDSEQMDFYFRISQDHGYTFGSKFNVGENVAGYPISSFIELNNGHLLWPWKKTDQNSSGFLCSVDGGKNWNIYRGVWGESTGIISFSAVACSNEIIAVANANGSSLIWILKTTNSGDTWTAPQQINVKGIEPCLFVIDENTNWLTCRDDAYTTRIFQNTNLKADWKPVIQLEPPSTQCSSARAVIKPSGQACFVWLPDDRIYVAFIAKVKGQSDAFFLAGNIISIK